MTSTGRYWATLASKRAISRRRALGLAGAGLTGAALLAACGGDDDAPTSGSGGTSPTSASGETPKQGGRFGHNTSDIANLNIVSSWREGTQLGGATVYDRPITAREDDRRFVLEAMESIEIPDPLTVIMKLRPGMVYQDFPPVNGRAVKADDIVATQEYVTSLEDAFDKTFQADQLERAEAPDDATVIYTLKKPNAYTFGASALGNANSQGIIPRETLDNLSTERQIGSGPYQPDTWTINSKYLYKRFEQFRLAAQGMPYIDEKEIFVFTDVAPIEAAFRSEQIHEWKNVPVGQLDRLESELADFATLYTAAGVQPYTFLLNMENNLPWQDDVRVREAIWRLTDRQEVLDLIFSGRGVLTTGLIPMGLPAYQLDPSETAQYFEKDIAKAKQLLSAANFDFEKEYRILGYVTEQTGQVWQQQLEKGDIKTRVVQVTPNEIFDYWSANDFDTTITGSPADNTPFQSLRLQHTDGWSTVFRHFGLQDPEIDALIEKSEQTVDAEENIRIVKEVQLKALKAYSSAWYILTRDYNDFVNSKIQDWEVVQAYPKYQHQIWFKD